MLLRTGVEKGLGKTEEEGKSGMGEKGNGEKGKGVMGK
jgi:hypothetical protein